MELDLVSQWRASSVRIWWLILEFMGLSKSFCRKKIHPYIETPPLQSIQSSTDPKVSMVPLDYYTSRSKECTLEFNNDAYPVIAFCLIRLWESGPETVTNRSFSIKLITILSMVSDFYVASGHMSINDIYNQWFCCKFKEKKNNKFFFCIRLFYYFFKHKELYGDDQDWFIRSYQWA